MHERPATKGLQHRLSRSKKNLCQLDKSGVTNSAVINFPKFVQLDSNQTPNTRCSLASLVLKWLTNQSRMAGAKVS